jgi:hypothetical protein
VGGVDGEGGGLREGGEGGGEEDEGRRSEAHGWLGAGRDNAY